MTSIDSWIEAHARFTPDKAAIRFEAGDLTYAQLAAAIGGTAHWLVRAQGIGRGDRVAFLGTNAPDMLVLLFAAARIGAILVPLNWRLAPPELAHAIQDSGAALLVHQPAFAATVAEMAALGAAPSVHESDARAGGLEALVAGGAALPEHEGEGAADDPLLIVYTSGTTGRPKGAVLTQGAIAANALNALHMHDMTSRDLVLTVLPMFHVGGLNIQTTPALYAGATVLLHERFHPEACLAAIAAERPDLTVLVPATLAALIAHPGWNGADLTSLRAIATGSSDVPRHLMRAFRERGVPVIQIYGSTETGPVAIYQRVQDGSDEFGAIGRPGLHTEARITRDGAPVAVGEVGEIELRGANITKGYWNRPEAQAECFRAGGWFRTGDLGSVDAQGVFWFRDRLKNVIISGGENIYPAELERVLSELDLVAEAAVVGVKDPQWGECPVAVVVARALQERDARAVLEGFNGRLARYKHPKSVVFVEELPRNALGKVRLDRVRNMAEDALASGTETTKA